MPSLALLKPVFALASWTACILLLVGYKRVTSCMAKRVDITDFARGESGLIPDDVALPNRNYMNLLELPVLFYLICLIGYATHAATSLVITLAWVYVGLRVIHSLIHLSYNRVFHRFLVFASSNAVLALMWLAVGIGLFCNG